MTGGSYVHLDCGNRVRHGSEQPYRELPMLEGLTGLRTHVGNQLVKRAPTLGVSTPAKKSYFRLSLLLLELKEKHPKITKKL